jgi:hypothetical protein
MVCAMQPTIADAEIRSNAAFPQVVRVARSNNWLFWWGIPLYAIPTIYGVFAHHRWAIVVAAVVAAADVAGQLYGFRRARKPLADISDQSPVRDRAWKLAASDAKPRMLRGLPFP